MSEALDRRQFLRIAGGLTVLSLEHTVLAQDPASTSLQDPLREFILACYDCDFTNIKNLSDEARKKLEGAEQRRTQARERLESQLTAHRLDPSIIAKLEKYSTDVPELVKHFSQRGLKFSWDLHPPFRGYELLRISEPEEREIEIFGKSHKVTITKILEELIPHTKTWMREYFPKAEVRAADCTLDGSSKIRLRPNTWHMLADQFYDLYRKEYANVEEEIKDPHFLDQFITSPKNLSSNFLHHFHQHVRYASMHKIYETSNSREEFVEKIISRMGEDIVWHEAMHAYDTANSDTSFLELKKLTEKERAEMPRFEQREIERKNAIKKELRQLYLIHLENRAALSAMAHGNSLDALANVTSVHTGKIVYANTPQAQSAKMLLKYFARYITTHQKDYPNLEFNLLSMPHLLKQLPKLSEEQVRKTAVGIYKDTYKGMRAAEYIKWFSE